MGCRRSCWHARAAMMATAALITAFASTGSADPPPEPGQHFTVDPVSDGLIAGTGVGLSTLLGAILATGEIRPSPPPVSASALLSIDRVAVTQTIDPNASTYSNIVLWAASGFAVLDTGLSGLRDGWDALLVDGLMYL